MKNKIYILIAPPCSGKSTWTRENIASMNNPYTASSDDIITAMYPELSYNEAFQKANFKVVKKIMRQELADAIVACRDIIIDRTNMTVKTRKEFLNAVNDTYEKIALVFPWDAKTFLERNEKRNLNEGKFISLKLWEDFCSNYQKPTLEEGFDKIIFLK